MFLWFETPILIKYASQIKKFRNGQSMKWNFIVLSIKFFLMGFLFSFCRVPPTRFCTENSNQRTGFVLIKQELRISVFLFFNSSRVFLMVTPFYCRRTQWKYRRRVLAIGGGNRFLEIVNGHSILLSSNPTTNVRNVFCRLVERARWGGKKKQDTIDPWRWASIFARRLCFPVSSLRTGWPFLSTDGYSSHLKAGTCCYFFSTTPNVGRPYRYVATVDAAMMERDVSDLLHKVHRVSFRCVVYDRVSLPHRTRPAFTALLHLIMLMAAPC